MPGQPQSLKQAQVPLAAGNFICSILDNLNLGNRAPARWLHFTTDHAQLTPRAYRAYVAEGWTDRMDAWLIGAGEVRPMNEAEVGTPGL